MNKHYCRNAIVILGLLAATYVNAQTTADTAKHNTSKQKDVTELVVNGQQRAAEWFRAESPHFIVYSDTKRDDVARVLDKLERLDHLLRTYTLNEKAVDTSPKLTFYYLKDFHDIYKIDNDYPSQAIGLYKSCAQGVQAFGAHMFYAERPNSDLQKKPENEGLSYIFAAYARHFIYRYSDLRAPTWYIDGFAHYFANTRFSDSETIVGMAPETISEYLRFLSGHRHSLDYKDILLQNNTKGHSYAGKAGVRLEFEAKSWVLTHYILSSSENIQHFSHYLNLIAKGTEPTRAFEDAFGYKVSKLGTLLQRYNYKADALKTNFAAAPIGAIRFSAMPLAANDLLLQDATLKACPDAKTTQALFTKIQNTAKKFPTSDFAQMVLSRAQIDSGNPQDAIPFLTDKASETKPDFDAVYLLGLAQLRVAEKAQGDLRKSNLESAQRNLLKACTLNPKAPEAFHAYFRAGVLAQENPSDDVLGSAILAWKQAREVNAYARTAALAHAYAEQTPEARRILTSMAQNSRDPQIAKWATSWQTRLNTDINRNELLQEMRLELAPNPQFSEWTVANTEVMDAITMAVGNESIANLIKEEQLNAKGMTQTNVINPNR